MRPTGWRRANPHRGRSVRSLHNERGRLSCPDEAAGGDNRSPARRAKAEPTLADANIPFATHHVGSASMLSSQGRSTTDRAEKRVRGLCQAAHRHLRAEKYTAPSVANAQNRSGSKGLCSTAWTTSSNTSCRNHLYGVHPSQPQIFTQSDHHTWYNKLYIV